MPIWPPNRLIWYRPIRYTQECYLAVPLHLWKWSWTFCTERKIRKCEKLWVHISTEKRRKKRSCVGFIVVVHYFIPTTWVVPRGIPRHYMDCISRYSLPIIFAFQEIYKTFFRRTTGWRTTCGINSTTGIQEIYKFWICCGKMSLPAWNVITNHDYEASSPNDKKANEIDQPNPSLLYIDDCRTRKTRSTLEIMIFMWTECQYVNPASLVRK